jgi:hypothetical protein
MGSDPLQALNPLREPPAVGWWPPAPGWWLLLALLLCALVAGLLWWRARRRRDAYRRRALLALSELRDAEQGSAARLREINAILKRAALVAFPQENPAALHGEAWFRFLDAGLPRRDALFSTLDAGILYQPEPAPEAERDFYSAAQYWVKAHRRGALDA